jgi:hypothetical protein
MGLSRPALPASSGIQIVIADLYKLFGTRMTLGITVASLICTLQLVNAQSLAIPLNSKDPNNKILIADDQTWFYTSAETSTNDAPRKTGVRLALDHDPRKGPVTLVVDYAAPKPDNDAAATLQVSIECMDANCPIALDQAMIGIRAAYMGEGLIDMGGGPIKTWAGRESRTYDLPSGQVQIDVDLVRQEKLPPQAIRVRAIYGEHDRSALPGQQTRESLLIKIVASLLAVGGLIYWLIKRE